MIEAILREGLIMSFLLSFVVILAAPWIVLLPLFMFEGIRGVHYSMTPLVIFILISYDILMGFTLIVRFILDKIGGRR